MTTYTKQQTLFDMIGATIHTQDSHCQLDPVGVCLICGVWHGPPCIKCGEKGYHLDGCTKPGLYVDGD